MPLHGFFYMHLPTDRIAHTKAFVISVVEHWLEKYPDPNPNAVLATEPAFFITSNSNVSGYPIKLVYLMANLYK